MIDLKNEEVRNAVRDRYSLIAKDEGACCSPNGGSSCCGSPAAATLEQASQVLGYGIQELKSLPDGANLGLGCGNPQAIADLKAGETVVDLGSGGGIDCFLAAQSVGSSGRVIGVDMTPDMVSRARKTAAQAGYSNVDFRLGEIEHLPVADGTVDVILSNCVINLSPDKPQVFREAFRVLRTGGRLAISDMVASGPIPEDLKKDLDLHSKCIVGSTPLADLEGILRSAGFNQIKIQPKAESRSFVKEWAPGTGIEDYILSATIEAVKPA
jgi:arsenite methyltransferase